MVEVNQLAAIIKRVLAEHASIPSTFSKIRLETVMDDAQQRYLLLSIGWDVNGRWIHQCTAHVEIVADKVVVLADHLLPSIRRDLLAAGIPREQFASRVRPQPEVAQSTHNSAAS